MAKQQGPSLGGQFDSWMREGAKDLWNSAIPAFPQSQRLVDEPGTPLNPTQFMVNEDLGTSRSYEAMLEGYSNRGRGPDQDRGIER